MLICHYCQLSKMADAAAARREARRRKILENSHNRLQIISGKPSDELPKELPVKTLVPEPEYDFTDTPTFSNQSSNSQLNGILYNPPADLLGFLSGTHDIDASGDAEVVNDLASLLPPTGLPLPQQSEPAEAPKLSAWEKIIAYKYDIVLLSLLLQILYSLSISFDNGNFFLPVLVYIVTKMVWFPTQSNSGIANMLMLLNGVSTARLQKLLYLTQCFGAITRDIFVFLFTTICIQSVCVMLRDNMIA